jgi:MFS family permease
VLRARDVGVLLTARRRWGAVVVLSVDQLVAWGVLYYAYAILAQPIARDLGVSRLVVAGAFSVCLATAGWAGRRLGPVLDARGTRGALRAGAIAAPIVFAAIAAAGGAVTLVVGFAALGVVHAVALYEPAFRTIVAWCPDDRTRSRAMLVVTSVGGLASTVFLPVTAWLVSRHGWRASVVVLAVMLAVVLVPGRFTMPLPDRGAAPPGTRRAAAAASERWLAAGLALHALASTGVVVYLVGHLVERGAPVAAAAAIAGLAGAAQLPGRWLSGPLRRSVGAAAFLPGLVVVQAIALAGIASLAGPAATACVVVFGAANGVMTLERATVIVEWYGRASFGVVQGRLAAVTGTARAIAPFAVEAGHRLASYAVVFGALTAVLAAAAWMCRSAARAARGCERAAHPVRSPP